ncbi:MAG: TolC family protein [Verrucomicrobiota bacterium]
MSIAVIETGENKEANTSLNQLFKDELVALLKDEYVITFKAYAIARNAKFVEVNALLDEIYAANEHDMVLVLDIASNQVLGTRSFFDKPTFLPFVFSGQLLGYPEKDGTSGKENLNYITRQFDFGQELKVLKTIAPFKKAVLITDARIQKSVANTLVEAAREQAKQMGVELSFIIYDGDAQKLASKIPSGIDTVLYAALPTVDEENIKTLIETVNARKLLSFSLRGERYVQLGAFATNHSDTDWKKLARFTAIQISEITRGEDAANLPIFFETTDRIVINMETSRQIRYAPTFAILSEAVLINEDNEDTPMKYSMNDVAAEAVKANLTIAAQRLQTKQARQTVNEVRGDLLPQLESSLDYLQRKETASTETGTLAESSTDASVTFTMPIFSEERWATFAIEKYTYLSEQELLKETELDIVQSAVNAYLDVLLQKTSLDQERYNLEITRKNYQLAKNRVDVGSTDASDLYRWESELATAKTAVLSAKSRLEQENQNLNRILNRPIQEAFGTTVETLDNPSLMFNDDRISGLINNIYSLQALTDLFVELGIERSPELKQIEANIASSRRQLKSDQFSFWVPDINLTSSYTHNVNEDRAPTGIAAEENDWQVGVTFSLPIFEGGSRYARAVRSRLSVEQLELEYQDNKNLVEQTIRSSVESVHASYSSIELAKISEVASQKNYDLISESYIQGQTSISDLLDAQETLIDARETSMNAVYTFLIDLMDLQRAVGAFDFFLTTPQRSNLTDEIIKRVNQDKTR